MDTASRTFLTIVIPAYDEEKRLPSTLDQVTTYLSGQTYTWKVIVVDDGSADRTAEVAGDFAKRFPNQVSVIRNPHCGKAFTVRTGLLAADGEYVFMCDADLSMPIGEIEKLLVHLENGYHVAIGSREARGAQRSDEPVHRRFMGRVFNRLVQLLLVPGMHDTQCGFKGFHGSVAHDVFQRLCLYSSSAREVRGPMVTGFDVEVLFLAKKAGYSIKEVPITWRYVAGSKVSPLKDAIRMFKDVVKVRLNDWRGCYG